MLQLVLLLLIFVEVCMVLLNLSCSAHESLQWFFAHTLDLGLLTAQLRLSLQLRRTVLLTIRFGFCSHHGSSVMWCFALWVLFQCSWQILLCCTCSRDILLNELLMSDRTTCRCVPLCGRIRGPGLLSEGLNHSRVFHVVSNALTTFVWLLIGHLRNSILKLVAAHSSN